MRVLFVCTLNRARSTTAERLFRRQPGLQVRSAGTSDRAVHPVTIDDLVWAELVIVFEAHHEHWIRAAFDGDLPPIVNAGIPDEFAADDPALCAELREVIPSLLNKT
jgi:predicted protein tyrosine phosphatase